MTPRLLLFSGVLCCLATACFAQDPGGFTVQKRKGFLMVKPQAWSKASEATLVEFEAFSDRTVKGTPGAGYYELQTKSQEKKQIQAARVVRLVIYPDPSQFTHVVERDERDAIAATVADLEKLSADYPPAADYVSASIQALRAEIARFDAGGIKVDGQWRNKETFRGAQAGALGKQITADINAAKSPSAFDLASDTRFIALGEMASTNTEAAALVKQLTDLHAKRVRDEQRKQILGLLAAAGTSPFDAEAAIDHLKSLKPSEDPRSESALAAWAAGKETVNAVNAAAKGAAAALEAEVQAAPVDVPPPLSSATTLALKDIQSKLLVFGAGRPSPALVSMAAPAHQTVVTGMGFLAVATQFAGNSYLRAKDTLDDIAVAAVAVGPASQKAVASLQRVVSAKIEEFTRLRQEGELLLASNKGIDALKKFEAAYAVIPDPGVAEQIAKLKGGG